MPTLLSLPGFALLFVVADQQSRLFWAWPDTSRLTGVTATAWRITAYRQHEDSDWREAGIRQTTTDETKLKTIHNNTQLLCGTYIMLIQRVAATELDSVVNKLTSFFGFYIDSRKTNKESIMQEPWHRRHDISDNVWERLEPFLLGRKGAWGGNARDNRQFINTMFWILCTGAPWPDLLPDYGGRKNTERRFCRWKDKGVWETILEALMDEPDLQWLIIDAGHIKVHLHATGARGGNQDVGRTKEAQLKDTFGRGCAW